MADELKDILSNLNKDIDQEKLLQYLNSKLPDSEQHALETQMNDDEFMNDAMEGLQQVNDKTNIPLLVQELNTGLKKQLEKKKRRKAKRQIFDQSWIILTVITILVLVVIAWLIIKKFSS